MPINLCIRSKNRFFIFGFIQFTNLFWLQSLLVFLFQDSTLQVCLERNYIRLLLMWNYKITQETVKDWSEKILPLSTPTVIPAVRITACSKTMQLFCPFINQDLHVYTPEADMRSSGHYRFCVRGKTGYISLEPTVCKTIVKRVYGE